MAWPILVFDLETIPDVAGLRQLGDYPEQASDAQVWEAWCEQRTAAGQSEFAPLYLQRILCISVAFRNAEGLRVHSFVDSDGKSEGKLLQQFFNSIDKHVPQLVSWNGGGFDLPVLHCRGLQHGVQASQYWEMGEGERDFKWNNYIGRYHTRHLDLMDLLALYQPRANAPLDAMAKLCGFAGKLGMDGSQVYAAYLDGKLDEIVSYCETDVMNTYLLYCRYQLMRGGFSAAEYAGEISMVRASLDAWQEGNSHWSAYLKAWPELQQQVPQAL